MVYGKENTISIGGNEGSVQFLSNINRPLDFEENTEASDYIMENYDKLVSFVRKNVGNKVADPAELVHDVWMSIKQGERIGRGYDPTMGKQEDGFITVAQFVYGRLKMYCFKAKSVTQGALERYEDEIDMMNAGDVDMDIINFANGGEKRVIKNRHASHEVSAYSSEELQFVYENSADMTSEEAFEQIDDYASINACIEELFNYDDDRIDMKPFLKNLSIISRKGIPTAKLRQMFSGLLEFAEEHDYFKSALLEVMTFAAKYPAQYQVIVAKL